MKFVLVRNDPYYDGVSLHPVGTILQVPDGFGMKPKRNPDTGEVLRDKKGDPVEMVPEDNFLPVTKEGSLPETGANMAMFTKGGEQLDPALEGEQPRVVTHTQAMQEMGAGGLVGGAGMPEGIPPKISQSGGGDERARPHPVYEDKTVQDVYGGEDPRPLPPESERPASEESKPLSPKAAAAAVKGRG